MFGLEIIDNVVYSTDIKNFEDHSSFLKSFEFIGTAKECISYLNGKHYHSIFGPLGV